MKPQTVNFEVREPDDEGRVYVFADDGWSGLVTDERSAEQLIDDHRAEVEAPPVRKQRR